MEDTEPVVTFIGKNLAKRGYRFQHMGASEECKTCKIYQVCIQPLEVGRIYEVVDVLDNEFTCPVLKDLVKVVRVKETAKEVGIQANKTFSGATLSFQPQECPNQISCEFRKFCVPAGLKEGDKLIISKIIRKRVPCSEGKEISLVLVHRRMPQARS